MDKTSAYQRAVIDSLVTEVAHALDTKKRYAEFYKPVELDKFIKWCDGRIEEDAQRKKEREEKLSTDKILTKYRTQLESMRKALYSEIKTGRKDRKDEDKYLKAQVKALEKEYLADKDVRTRDDKEALWDIITQDKIPKATLDKSKVDPDCPPELSETLYDMVKSERKTIEKTLKLKLDAFTNEKDTEYISSVETIEPLILLAYYKKHYEGKDRKDWPDTIPYGDATFAFYQAAQKTISSKRKKELEDTGIKEKITPEVQKTIEELKKHMEETPEEREAKMTGEIRTKLLTEAYLEEKEKKHFGQEWDEIKYQKMKLKIVKENYDAKVHAWIENKE